MILSWKTINICKKMEIALKIGFYFILLLSLPLSLAVCPNKCTCDDESLHANCKDASLQHVPITLNPSLQRLMLQNNQIRSIDIGTLTYYHELIHVDLSNNELVRIQPGSFNSQMKLVQLNLNSNKISHLNNKTFGSAQSVMSSLAVLNLHKNLIDGIDPSTFIYTPNLEELDLTYNSLRVLNASSFLGLRNLRILKLDHNELNQVPDVFSLKNEGGLGFGSRGPLLPQLAELSLGNNGKIVKIGPDAFSAAINLVSLDLRGCFISFIDIHAFRGLNVLRRLVLTDNSLLEVPTISFPPLAQLETLRIGRNLFDKVPKLGFGGLKKLKNLEIAGAPELSLIEQDAFANNLDLENVELSSCKKLGTLPPKLFKGLSAVKNLNLKDNALTDIPEDLVSWQSLRSIQLEGNPFRCVCELFWLRDLLQQERFQNASAFVLCAEPPELANKKLSTLNSQDLNCYLQSPIQKTILGISIAVTILILVVIFFLLYRYHESIKNTCKRGFRRPNRRKRSSVISSGKELDTATKTSFLSHSPYPYTDDDFQVRASLMGSGGGGLGSPGPNYLPHPAAHTLNPVTMSSLNYPYNGNSNSFNSHSLRQHQHPYKSTPNNYTPNYHTNEYDAPINSINYPHLHNQEIEHSLPIHPHYTLQHHGHVNVKPIPITEL